MQKKSNRSTLQHPNKYSGTLFLQVFQLIVSECSGRLLCTKRRAIFFEKRERCRTQYQIIEMK